MSNGMDYHEFIIQACMRGAKIIGKYYVNERYGQGRTLFSVHVFSKRCFEVGYWHPGLGNDVGPMWFNPYREWHFSFYDMLDRKLIESFTRKIAAERINKEQTTTFFTGFEGKPCS